LPSRVTTFLDRTFLRDDVVVIRYEDSPCPELAGELRLPVEMEMPRPLLEAHASESAQAGTVTLRALIAVDGTPHDVTVFRATRSCTTTPCDSPPRGASSPG
jgi:hypothetical protein